MYDRVPWSHTIPCMYRISYYVNAQTEHTGTNSDMIKTLYVLEY